MAQGRDAPAGAVQGDGIVDLRGVRIDTTAPEISDIIRRALTHGWYEAAESEAVDLMLREGDVVVEFGAGCGFISAYVALSGKARRVHAVEANPNLIPIIARTHALTGTMVEIHNELAGPADGTHDFILNRDFWASAMAGVKGEHVRLPMRAFRARMGQWRPSFVIMDIEGAELDLVRLGFPRHVERVVLEVHESAYGASGVAEIRQRMADQGFQSVPAASKGPIMGFERPQIGPAWLRALKRVVWRFAPAF